MAATLEPGQRAFAARFDHLPERHRSSWDELDPVAKAIWARVEAACQPEPAAPVHMGSLLAAYHEGYKAAYQPGCHYDAQCAGLRAVIREMRGGAA